ncbi:MAG: hypothetical protein IPN34_15180 [Planctomycetes bacterium]|nr:hypothetical protein [Planctomycetota bacterium]
MKTWFVVLFSFLAWGASARAQCCLGAQNVSAISANGRFRVQAISVVGTGIQHHGPYVYRLRMEARSEGSWRELGVFDLRWETREHFGLELYVSSTGNGVLIDMSGSPNLEFRTARGELVASHPRSVFDLSAEKPKDSRYLTIIDAEPVPIPGHRNALNYVPCGRLFLPFGAPVGSELEQRLLDLLSPKPRDTSVRATAGHAQPERDLVLLGALLTYPSARVAKLASARLDALLPENLLRESLSSYAFADIADWLALHAHELRWDDGAQCYER